MAKELLLQLHLLLLLPEQRCRFAAPLPMLHFAFSALWLLFPSTFRIPWIRSSFFSFLAPTDSSNSGTFCLCLLFLLVISLFSLLSFIFLVKFLFSFRFLVSRICFKMLLFPSSAFDFADSDSWTVTLLLHFFVATIYFCYCLIYCSVVCFQEM